MERTCLAALALALVASAATAETCRDMAPDLEQFRQTMEVNRLSESVYRQKLKTPKRVDYAIGVLVDYEDLTNKSLTTVDDMETRANTLQETKCPGWEQSRTMDETSMVIKSLKARLKGTREQINANLARLRKMTAEGKSGMVTVTFR
jgi:5-bromo-4-chloroindolyl phosphate hydrolysis protein